MNKATGPGNHHRHRDGRLPMLFATATLLLLGALFILVIAPRPAAAWPEFSGETGLACRACHVHPDGGPGLTATGEGFRQADYNLNAAIRPHLGGPLLRLLVGFLHLTGVVIWLGTIFYIHLFIKPQSLTGGLPRSEMLLGRVCVVIVGVTGIILSVWRLAPLEHWWRTTFGIFWLIKVTAFLLMVMTAALVTTRIDRRLRSGTGNTFSPALPDGQNGSPAHFAYEETVYDASGSRLWPDGVHMRRHRAGTDLSAALADAPHGPEVLKRLPVVGPAPAVTGTRRPAAARLFILLAYAVLAFAATALFCVAWWHYGPPLALLFG
jgi:predicted heme/steroid binding protein